MAASKTGTKTTGKKTTAKKPAARKVTARSPKKVAAKKATAKRATMRRATTTRSSPVASLANRPASRGKRQPSRAATPVGRSSTGAMKVRQGDLIFIDSAQVGSPPREGEVIKVIHGDLSISYRVKWTDGTETLISPGPGTAHLVRT